MPAQLNLLLIENESSDVELLIQELRQSGFDPNWQCVQTETDFRLSLKASPDIILTEYCLPEFNIWRALEIVKGQNLNIPVILVTGKVAEERAVAAIKQGAVDYIMKDRMMRLGAAVRRALDGKEFLEAGRKSEVRSELLSQLGKQLSDAANVEAAAHIIVDAADKFFGWDACYLDLYIPEADRVRPIINIDNIEGRRQDVIPVYEDTLVS